MSRPIRPTPCHHDNAKRVTRARWVFGSSGILPAEYVCLDCGCRWNVDESPDDGLSIYKQVEVDDDE